MSPSPPPVFSLANLRAIYDRWKKLLALAAVLAVIVSVIVALLKPNIYSSTAVFLPTSPQSADPDRLVEGAKLELGVRSEDLDRVVSIGESLPLAERMIKKFHLYKHYEVDDSTTDRGATKALAEFNSYYTIVHNERDAIEVTFQDRDKKLAARIANTIVVAIDSVNRQLTYENRQQVLKLYRQRSAQLGNSYETARQRLLAARRRYGVYGLEQQGRYISKEIIELESKLRQAEAGGGGNAAALRRALHALTRADGGNIINLENITIGSDSVNLLATRLTDLQGRFVGSQAAVEQAEGSLNSRGVSSLYLIQKAYPATRKSGPFRALIVLSSVFVTLALCTVFILLLELYRRREQLNF